MNKALRTIAHALTGAILFLLLSIIIPLLFNIFTPTSHFIRVWSIVDGIRLENTLIPEGDVFCSGETMSVTFYRYVYTDTKADVVRELVLTSAEGDTEIYAESYIRSVNVIDENKLIKISYQIPEVPEGTYYWQGISQIEIDHNAIPIIKSLSFRSLNFEIKDCEAIPTIR